MKSILIVCHAWHEENFGGAFKLAGEFAQYLGDCGYDVHFLCGTDLKTYANPTKKNGVYIWRYQFPKAPSPSPANLWAHLYRTWLLTRKIARKTDIGYLNGHSPLQFLGACAALKHRNPRKVYGVHSPFVEELRTNWGVSEQLSVNSYQAGCLNVSDLKYKPKIRRKATTSFKIHLALRIVRHLEKMIYQQADRIQCDSAFSLSVIRKSYHQDVADKGVVCPGWIDPERFQPVKSRDVIRGRLGYPWKAGIPTFLSVRRLEKRMGLDNLIAACGILKAEGFLFQVLIGGVGQLESQLVSEISCMGLNEYVHLLGRISEKMLPFVYSAADCFVLPTRSLECFGLIVLEAFACNTPVIATPVGSIPEVMGEYGNQGWLSADSSANAIADRMRAFLNGVLKPESANLREHASLYATSVILPELEAILTM